MAQSIVNIKCFQVCRSLPQELLVCLFLSFIIKECCTKGRHKSLAFFLCPFNLLPCLLLCLLSFLKDDVGADSLKVGENVNLQSIRPQKFLTRQEISQGQHYGVGTRGPFPFCFPQHQQLLDQGSSSPCLKIDHI